MKTGIFSPFLSDIVAFIGKEYFCPKWKIELDNSTKYSRLDMSIKNERRPEPIDYKWGKIQ